MKLYLYPSIALAFVRGFQVYLHGLDTWKARDVNVNFFSEIKLKLKSFS
jgi:hypothetical protein